MHRAAVERDRSPGMCHSDHPTRATIEFRFHLTEARLWTLSFPKEAEEFAFPLAQEESSDPADRSLGIDIVGFLARIGNARAEQLLESLSRSNSKIIAMLATSNLAQGDPQGRYRELYWRRALAGDHTALVVLGDWVDPGSRKVLEEIIATGEPTEQELAWSSLRRIYWLEAADWAHRIAIILVARRGADLYEFEWALRVARNRSLPGLTGILRKRLEEVEAEHVEYCKQIYEGLENCVATPPHEGDFSCSMPVIASLDWHFDDVLKAFSELGGGLTPLERQRLELLGYGNHPRKRLFEFVSAWK